MHELPDLRTALGAVPIRRDVVRVYGPQALEFLQGQLSQDVSALVVGESAVSLLLQPTGKVEAWLRVTRIADDAMLLDVDGGWGLAVLARLKRFKLRTDAELDLEEWAGLAIRGPGAGDIDVPPGSHGLRAFWPGVDGIDVLSAGEIALAGVPLVEPAALEALRIECGVPAMGAELTDATIPAEAGAWLIDASVSFTKGCYTGQELVARIDSRGGNVPHPVRGLRIEAGPVPVGTEILVGDKQVGTVTSIAHSPRLGDIALGLVSRSTTIGDVVELRWSDGVATATVAELPL
ncbi:MAG: glycine cleavage T C-terminal barrel domain-containing protein [Acidimicrobiales bacterium]